MKSKIIQSFPKLGGTEFQLMKASGGGPGKQLFTVFGNDMVPSARALTASSIGIIYIRPLSNIINQDDNDSIEDSDSVSGNVFISLR
jgi:hypothetical protein